MDRIGGQTFVYQGSSPIAILDVLQGRMTKINEGYQPLKFYEQSGIIVTVQTYSITKQLA